MIFIKTRVFQRACGRARTWRDGLAGASPEARLFRGSRACLRDVRRGRWFRRAARRYHRTMDTSIDDITGWIKEWQDGDDRARDRVFERLYGQLKRLAWSVLRSESGHETLQPTALLNDALMKLLKARAPAADDRGHFARIVARAMRQILVDRARRKLADKRGAGQRPLAFDAERHDVALTASPEQMVSFDQAMQALADLDPTAAAVVELRVFAGMTIEETALALEMHPSAVNREWAHASAWLKCNLFAAAE